jgi:hypothetical protein
MYRTITAARVTITKSKENKRDELDYSSTVRTRDLVVVEGVKVSLQIGRVKYPIPPPHGCKRGVEEELSSYY